MKRKDYLLEISYMNLNKNSHLLTFEWDKENQTLEIHGDVNGLNLLKNKLEFLIKIEKQDHTHLMSKEWGGDEITEKKQSPTNDIISSVKIFKWNNS